jgi:hypothetical protein
MKGTKMRTLLTAIIFVCLLVAGCSEEVCQPTGWLMVGPDLDTADNSVIGRAGILNKDGVEFGVESQYAGKEGGQSYGAYAMQEIQVVNLGKQYIGARAAIYDIDEGGNNYGFIAGEIIPISENIDSVIETQINEYDRAVTGTDDDWLVFAGIRMKF